MSSKIVCSSLSETPFPLTSLPGSLMVDIIAHVPRRYYPTLSLVSKRFRAIVASPELYKRRSLLGCTEHFLYALLLNKDTREYRLYIRKSNGLVLIPTLPPLPSNGSLVAVGSKIYVLGGVIDHHTRVTSSAFAIDCVSHTTQPISGIPTPMFDTVSEIIDEKIYVIGKLESSEFTKRVMVFDTETQTWESEMEMMAKPEIEISGPLLCGGLVMPDKLYLRDSKNSFVYRPKESKWEIDEKLNSYKWMRACVVEDVLYYYDHWDIKLRAYDPKKRCWVEVKGVGQLIPDAICYSRSVSYGEKLVVFLPNAENAETWCAEIALERRQGGEIWGKVERCEVVIDGPFVLVNSVAIMV